MLPDRRQTLFINDTLATHQDRQHQWFSETVPQQPESLKQCCLLASRLFLKPEAVLHWCQYWISQFSNYDLEEKDWLTNLVHGLIYEAPQIRMLASETPPLGNVGHMALRATQLFRFAGGDTHAIPLEYVLRTGQFQIMQACSLLLQSHRQSFMSRSDDSLDGELALGGFVYNQLLREFYEPGFMIITLFRLHLCELMHNSGAQSWQDVLGRHFHSLQAITHDAIDWPRVEFALGHGCCVRLQQELLQLHQSLYRTDLDEALQLVSILWSEKATECDEEACLRPVRVLQRLQ